MARIKRSTANIRKEGFLFQPLRVEDHHQVPLREMSLKPQTELLAFERGGERRCVLLPEAAYHHVIQGVLASQPYLVTY